MNVVNAVSPNFVQPRIHYTLEDYHMLTPHGRFVILYDFCKKMRNRYFTAEGKSTTLELVVNSAAVYFECKCDDIGEKRDSLYKKWLERVSLKLSYEADLFEILSNVMDGSMIISEISDEDMNHIYFIFKNEFDNCVKEYEEENGAKPVHKFSNIFKSLFS